MADTEACSEMTHYILIALRPAAGAGEPAETKGRVLHLSSGWLSFSIKALFQ